MEITTRIFLFAFAFSLSAMAGCGASSNDKSSPPPQEQTDDGEDTADDGDDTSRDDGDDTSRDDGDDDDTRDDGDDDDTRDDGDDDDDTNDDDGDDDDGDDGDDVVVDPGDPLPSELFGVWESDNIPLSDPDSGDSCAKSRVEFIAPASEGEPAIMKGYFIEFYNTDCTGPKWTTAIRVAVKNAGSVDAPSGATGLDYTLQEMAIAANSEQARDTLKLAQGGAGFCANNFDPADGYEIGAYRRIMGKSCTHSDGRELNFPDADTVTYDVFKIVGGKLNLGISINDEGTEVNDQRPTTFNDLPYTKQ